MGVPFFLVSFCGSSLSPSLPSKKRFEHLVVYRRLSWGLSLLGQHLQEFSLKRSFEHLVTTGIRILRTNGSSFLHQKEQVWALGDNWLFFPIFVGQLLWVFSPTTEKYKRDGYIRSSFQPRDKEILKSKSNHKALFLGQNSPQKKPKKKGIEHYFCHEGLLWSEALYQPKKPKEI